MSVKQVSISPLEISYAFLYVGTIDFDKDPCQFKPIKGDYETQTLSPGEVYRLVKNVNKACCDGKMKVSSVLIFIKSVEEIDNYPMGYKLIIHYIELDDDFPEKTFELESVDFNTGRVSIDPEYYQILSYDIYASILSEYIPSLGASTVQKNKSSTEEIEPKEPADCPLYKYYTIWNQDGEVVHRSTMNLRNGEYTIHDVNNVNKEDKLPMVAYSINGCNILVGHSDDIKESYEELNDLKDPFFDMLVDCDEDEEDSAFIPTGNKHDPYDSIVILYGIDIRDLFVVYGYIALFLYNEWKIRKKVDNDLTFRISDFIFSIKSIDKSKNGMIKVELLYQSQYGIFKGRSYEKSIDVEILGEF